MHLLQIRTESFENIECIYLSGRLDVPGVLQIELKFTVLTATQRKPVIVDLSEVEIITSMGLGMLISNAKALKNHGKLMILLKPRLNVEKVIRMSGLDLLLPIESDLQSAIRRIKGE